MIAAGPQSGVFSDVEHRMLQRLLRFRHRVAKEAMVARLDVVGVEADADLATAIETCVQHGVTQLPVYEAVRDTVVGIVHLHDLIRAADGGASVRSVAREPYVVPESKEIDELLTELRADRRRIAVVADEFGSTAGIVTIENIVEEISGEVLTETEPQPIRRLADDAVIVRGDLNGHEANDALGLELPESGEFETVAGLILSRAGRLVGEGESVTDNGVTLTVETAENNRVPAVRVEPGGADSPRGDPSDDE